MISVYKFKLPSSPGPFSLELARDAEILSVCVQYGAPYLYVRLDTDAGLTDIRDFSAIETGKPAPLSAHYVGTAMLHGDAYVLHYFGGEL